MTAPTKESLEAVRDVLLRLTAIDQSDGEGMVNILLHFRDEAVRAEREYTVNLADTMFLWLTTHARHAPYCEQQKTRIVPDGAYRSGLCKDYGGRYATEEERSKIACTCGLSELYETVCLAGHSARDLPKETPDD